MSYAEDAVIAPSPGVSRWEAPDERWNRLLEEHGPLLDLNFPSGYRVYGFPSMEFFNLFGLWAADPSLHYAAAGTRTLVQAFCERYPDLAVSPVRPHYALYDRYGPAKGETSLVPHVNQSTPLVLSVAPLGTCIMLFARTRYAQGAGDETALFIVGKDVPPIKVYEFLEELLQAKKRTTYTSRTIRIYGEDEGITIPEQSWTTWDRVFLDQRASTAVREDLEFFLQNEAEFKRVGIPYKRGYLLHGPPGNGKSTICRAIATSMPFASFAFDFSNPDFGNRDLTKAFKWAASNAPSVFFLEDIDRVWANKGTGEGENHSKITLDHLLNSIDGIAMHDGLVVVATANNPKSLDQAILNRPGRFDAVVELGNPDYDLRLRYFQWLFRKTSIGPSTLARAAETTEGVSMSHVKEVFVLSIKSALKNKREAVLADVEVAVDRVMEMFNGVSASSRRKAGFAE